MGLGPIQSAKNLPLAGSTLPNVADAMYGWFQSLIFTRVVKTIVDYQAVETKTNYSFYGVKQPFTAQQLMIKPEGQRKWKWFTVHAEITLILVPDEIIYFGSENYRVMQKLDYKEYGYVEYHLVQDYTG